MSEWVTESFLKWFIQNIDSFWRETSDFLWVSQYYLLNWFFQNNISFRNETNEWLNESFIKPIHSKTLIY